MKSEPGNLPDADLKALEAYTCKFQSEGIVNTLEELKDEYELAAQERQGPAFAGAIGIVVQVVQGEVRNFEAKQELKREELDLLEKLIVIIMSKAFASSLWLGRERRPTR